MKIREGCRVITTPRARQFLRPIPAGLTGTVVGESSHGHAACTRYSIFFDNGTRASDLEHGVDFKLAPPMTRAEAAVAAESLRRALKITPAMDRAMIEALEVFHWEARPPVAGGNRATAFALARRGLADALYGRTTTAYDGYRGARLSRDGVHVARILRADRRR